MVLLGCCFGFGLVLCCFDFAFVIWFGDLLFSGLILVVLFVVGFGVSFCSGLCLCFRGFGSFLVVVSVLNFDFRGLEV